MLYSFMIKSRSIRDVKHINAPSLVRYMTASEELPHQNFLGLSAFYSWSQSFSCFGEPSVQTFKQKVQISSSRRNVVRYPV